VKRVIYLMEGDTVEVRIVPEGYERTFKDWERKPRPSKMLLRFWHNRIAPTDPSVYIDHSNEAWK